MSHRLGPEKAWQPTRYKTSSKVSTRNRSSSSPSPPTLPSSSTPRFFAHTQTLLSQSSTTLSCKWEIRSNLHNLCSSLLLIHKAKGLRTACKGPARTAPALLAQERPGPARLACSFKPRAVAVSLWEPVRGWRAGDAGGSKVFLSLLYEIRWLSSHFLKGGGNLWVSLLLVTLKCNTRRAEFCLQIYL